MPDGQEPDRDSWRLDRLEEWRRTIDQLKPEVLSYELHALSDTVRDVRKEMNSLRRALITVALTVTSSAIVFALTIFLAFRK